MYIEVFLIGLFVGSFLNVLVDRLPRDESVIGGRSHCDKCKKILKLYDLIPLFSFLYLRGKCRYCRTPLSFYYPVVEMTTGALFVLALKFTSEESLRNTSEVAEGLLRGGSLDFVIAGYYLFIISSLIVIFFTDLKYGIIPDKIIFPAIIISFSYLILNTQYLILPHILSAVGASLFFLALFLITKGRGMGFGDVKFSFLMGLVLGFPGIAIALYIAFLTGALIGCILIVWKKKKLSGTKIPFGPFLVFGTVIALFFGEGIMQNILQFLRVSP